MKFSIFQNIEIPNFFCDFKGVPDEGASCRARAGLARDQASIPALFFKWTSRSKVMASCQPWYIWASIFLTVTLLRLIHSESRVFLVFNICAKGFWACLIWSLDIVHRRWYVINRYSLRKFPFIWHRFYVHDRILREKLCDFKKKLTSIRPLVRKLW